MSLNLEGGSSLTTVLAVATNGAALTLTSGSVKTYSTSAFGYALNGDAWSNAAVSATAAPTLDGNTGLAFVAQAAGTAAAYVWAIDASQVIKVFKGPTVSWTDATASSTACPLPAIPGNVTPFAVHTIQNSATTGSSWTFGVGLWNATGITTPVVKQLAQLRNTPLLTV
jgi:hypothetical protein